MRLIAAPLLRPRIPGQVPLLRLPPRARPSTVFFSLAGGVREPPITRVLPTNQPFRLLCEEDNTPFLLGSLVLERKTRSKQPTAQRPPKKQLQREKESLNSSSVKMNHCTCPLLGRMDPSKRLF